MTIKELEALTQDQNEDADVKVKLSDGSLVDIEDVDGDSVTVTIKLASK